jgi:hypothetical protein
MPLVHDLIKRSDKMLSDRFQWEAVWRQVCDLCLPFGPRFRHPSGGTTGINYDALMQGPVSAERGKYIYDSTPIWVVDRLTAGIESMATPSAQKWHGMKPAGVPTESIAHDERLWCDRFRDYMFETRYNPKSAFTLTNQKSIRNATALGTSVFFVEESFGTYQDSTALPMTYQPVPLSEVCLAVDPIDVPNTAYRRYMRSARNVVKQFGKEKVSPKVREMADDTDKMDNPVELLHCVMPRDESDTYKKIGKMGAQTASYYCEVDTKHLIGEGGYFEFPFIVYYWNQSEGNPYGESPMMYALADVKMLQLMNRNSIRAFSQWVDPPLATAANGVLVNLNSRAINAGMLDPNGNLRIKPIITQGQPNYAEESILKRRESLKESLYLNLFQTLIEHPEMTATEAMIRANEKGDILGPLGAKIQAGQAHMFDREFGILIRKGAIDEDSYLAPPPSLMGKDINIEFSSPLDRLRRSHELTGIQQTLDIVTPIAAADPSVMDNVNGDEIFRTAREITGAPIRIVRSKEEVEAIREQRKLIKQAQQNAAAAIQAGEAAKNLVPAAKDAPAALQGARDAMGQFGLPVPGGAAPG